MPRKPSRQIEFNPISDGSGKPLFELMPIGVDDGIVPTYKEWQVYAEGVSRFYNGKTDRDIKEINDWNLESRRDAERRWEEEMRKRFDDTHIEHETPGFIYVLMADNGKYKIGKTSNPEDRFKTLGVQLPYKLKSIICHPVKDMNEIESKLHLRYSGKRLHGEWFELSEGDLTEISEYLSNA